LTNDNSIILQKIMAKEKKEKKIVNKTKRNEQISNEEPIKKKRKEEKPQEKSETVAIGSSVAFDWNEEPEEPFEFYYY
jgi:hypothetical protein